MAEVNSTAEQPFVLILVGLPGSGKSHFASRLEEKSARFVRINQDVLGDRPACEKLARSVLADGKIAVIDRCNFDVNQRKKWIQIANEKGVQ
jgi:predicted kinase